MTFWLGEVPSQTLGAVSCALLFFMMLLTFVDVAGRYVFSSPLPAAYEIISLTMPGIIFCALPFVSHHESHVTIDLLDSFLTPALKRWQGAFANLFAAIALGFIAYRLYALSQDHMRFRQVTHEMFLSLWPFSFAMAVLCAIATLAFVANAWAYLTNGKIRISDGGVTLT